MRFPGRGACRHRPRSMGLRMRYCTWGPVLRAPLEYYGISIGTEWPVEKFGSSEIHRCTVGFPQTIS